MKDVDKSKNKKITIWTVKNLYAIAFHFLFKYIVIGLDLTTSSDLHSPMKASKEREFSVAFLGTGLLSN